MGDAARSWRGADFAHCLGTKNALVVVVFLVVVGLAGVVLVVLLVLVVGFVDVHSDTPVVITDLFYMEKNNNAGGYLR